MAILNLPARTADSTVEEHVSDHALLRNEFNDGQVASTFFPAELMIAVSNVPSLTTVSNIPAWLLDQATEEILGTTFRPQHANGTAESPGTVKFLPRLWIANPTGTIVGNVTFTLEVTELASGSTPVQFLSPASSRVTVAVPGQLFRFGVVEMPNAAMGTTGMTVGRLYSLRLARDATNASDTLAADIAIIGLDLVRA